MRTSPCGGKACGADRNLQPLGIRAAPSHTDRWDKDRCRPLASQSPWSPAHTSCSIWGGKDPLCLLKTKSSPGEGMTLHPCLMQSDGVLQPASPECVGVL